MQNAGGTSVHVFSKNAVTAMHSLFKEHQDAAAGQHQDGRRGQEMILEHRYRLFTTGDLVYLGLDIRHTRI